MIKKFDQFINENKDNDREFPPTISKSAADFTKKEEDERKDDCDKVINMIKQKMKPTKFKNVIDILNARVGEQKGKKCNKMFFKESYLEDFEDAKWYIIKNDDYEEIYKIMMKMNIGKMFFSVYDDSIKNECALYKFICANEENMLSCMLVNSYGGTKGDFDEYDEEDFEEVFEEDDEEDFENDRLWCNWFIGVHHQKLNPDTFKYLTTGKD